MVQVVLALVCWSLVVFANLAERQAPAKVVPLEFRKVSTPDAEVSARKRYLGTPHVQNLTVYPLTQLYSVNLAIGSDKQSFELFLDTGSSDLWVPNTEVVDPVSSKGVYDPSKSTDFHDLGIPFAINYLDGSYAVGNYCTDLVSFIDGPSLQLQFGNVNNATLQSYGILGIGVAHGETLNQGPVGPEYPSLPYALAKAGIIDRPVYSLFLNSHDSTGTILFGGKDTAKYKGDLVKVKSSNTSDHFLNIKLNSVLTDVALYDVNINTIFDTGATISYLPPAVVDRLISDFGGNTTTGVVPCSGFKNVVFSFTGKKIKVPYAELLQHFDDGTCGLNIFYSDNAHATLGDNFLRRAYVVFDLEDKSISLAEVKYTGRSNIVAFEGTGPLPF